jgi:hypothetical protein
VKLINWQIAGHPANWLTVFFMMFIFVLAVDLAFGRKWMYGPQLQTEDSTS